MVVMTRSSIQVTGMWRAHQSAISDMLFAASQHQLVSASQVTHNSTDPSLQKSMGPGRLTQDMSQVNIAGTPFLK